MIFHKFRPNSFCFGQKYYSVTKDMIGEITFNKKTGKEIKILIGHCSKCNRKKIMIVINNTVADESLGDFFKSWGENFVKVARKITKKGSKNEGLAFDNTGPKAILSKVPDVINFCHTGRRFYLRKFV